VSQVAAGKSSGIGGAVAGGLAQGAKGLAAVAGKRLLSSATDRIGGVTERLTEYSENGGGPGLVGAITGNGGKPGGSGGQKLKVTNIVEWADVGVPVRLAYDQWTQFTDFPSFMKKVESVEQEEETKLKWRAQIFLSHRSWDSTIMEQVPDKRIVWKSDGAKGFVDGAVTFHELGPELTRICLILEYHPQGFFEKTANIWRAQGRRARLEFKHFVRHLMTEAILHPDEIQGWRGEIHEGEVVKDDEQARSEEEERAKQAGQPEEDESGERQEKAGRRQEGSRQEGRRPSRRDEGDRGGAGSKAGAGRRSSGGGDRSERRAARGQGRDDVRTGEEART
jgi:hypothetical protein